MSRLYKLIYFNLNGRAEPARYMFHLAGVPYVDKRIPHEEWPALKSTIGFGKLPVLEVDGKELTQSRAICKYIASNHGFYPTDVWEQARVDEVTDTVLEIDNFIPDIFLEQDQKRKAKLQKMLSDDCLRVGSNLQKLLKKNHNLSGWFVGDKITLADVAVFCMYHDLVPAVLGTGAGGYDFKKLTSLEAFVTRFKMEPKITEWINTRPKVPM